MKQRLFWLVCAATLVGCGGGRMAELKVVKPSHVAAGPAATPEELSGEAPPLRGLADTIPLVPPELIPPEPPADPAFE
jgi:hypothetical protein